MKFSEEIWKDSQSIVQRIYEHPFNQALAKGTLDKEKFQFYLKQDSLYLIDFSRALAITGARSSQADEISTFINFSLGSLIAERSLHEHYFKLYGIKVDISQSPSCFAYTQFLLATASLQDRAVSVAALLPCFWVYREVGRYILKRSIQKNPYQKWIDAYSGADFDQSVDRAISLMDRIATESNPGQRTAMKFAFKRSCLLEWMFWDSAYHLEEFKEAS